MSWKAIQSNIRFPTHPGGAITGPFYINGDGYIRYLFAGQPTISHATKIGFSLYINGTELLPVYTSYNGYFGFVGGNYKVWYHHRYGWVVINSSYYPINCPLYEYWDITDWDDATVGMYRGMPFYTFSSFPALDGSVTAYGRGGLRGAVYEGTSTYTLTIETKWERWETDSSDILYGLYSPLGAASENRYFGSPQWINGSVTYCRTPTADSETEKYDYGSIVWNTSASKYILGTYNSMTGWWESSEPPVAGSDWTLTFAKPSGSDADEEDVTLSWDKWTYGPYMIEIYLFGANKVE